MESRHSKKGKWASYRGKGKGKPGAKTGCVINPDGDGIWSD